MIIAKAGVPILTLEDWRRHAPPKSPDAHWRDGRSAKETARAWLTGDGTGPVEVGRLWTSHPDFDGVSLERIEPEALVRFDAHGGPRNADLAIWARDAHGPIGITVEAKADEPFDLPVVEVMANSLERILERPESARIARVSGLTRALFGPRLAGQPRIADLRYQLLTATAGTLAHAATIGARRAVLVVHEFVTPATSRARLAANASDLTTFVHRLSNGAVREIPDGRLYGPFVVPGEPLFASPPGLYIGKAVRTLGQPAP